MITKRFIELDLLRGLAVIGMVIFHIFFILDYYGNIDMEMQAGFWVLLARFVQFTFLFLVGISLVLSRQNAKDRPVFIKKQIKRFLYIAIIATLINLVTYFVVGDDFVRFGILHLIAVSILWGIYFAEKPFVSLFTGLLIMFLSPVTSTIYGGDSIFLNILGFKTEMLRSLDYFPIFPWMALPLFGIAAGHIFFNKKRQNGIMNTSKQVTAIFKPIIFMGNHSLQIYVLHVPGIFLILTGIDLL